MKCVFMSISLCNTLAKKKICLVMLEFCFTILGLTTRWKQVVAYYFTPTSVDGSVFKPIVIEIIKEAEAIGLQVISVTSDMGSSNKAMWREFGIVVNRHCVPVTNVTHPIDSSRDLSFIADVPHLIKNLKAALCNHKQGFVLHNDVVQMFNLPSNCVSIAPISCLLDFQQSRERKLAPKLTAAVLEPSHFNKMKVSHALNLFSKSVSSALTYITEQAKNPSSELHDFYLSGETRNFLTTAWFVEQCNHWFDLMSSRHPVLALSKNNSEAYSEAVNFLKKFIHIIETLKIGRGEWKPVQRGIILSTTSILKLTEVLLDDHSFILTSRFSQDCLENLFSTVRLKNPIPTPLEFKRNLKLIMAAQFLKMPAGASYEVDDRSYLVDLLHTSSSADCNTESKDCHREDSLMHIELSCQTQLPAEERTALYYVAGYCLQSLRKRNMVCEHCYKSATTADHLESVCDLTRRVHSAEYRNQFLV